MKKKFIVLVLILRFTNLYSQWFHDPIDSTIRSIHLSEKDWVISLTIQQDGSHYDNLGKRDSSDANGTFIMKKIKDSCYLQRINAEYSDKLPVLKSGHLLNIVDSIVCLYTKESIKQSEHEWIYPFIYRNDSLGVYEIQGQSDHSPYYQLQMRTSQFEYEQRFMEIEMFASPTHTELYTVIPKNLNAGHNMNTFVYRAFMNFIRLLKNQYKIYLRE